MLRPRRGSRSDGRDGSGLRQGDARRAALVAGPDRVPVPQGDARVGVRRAYGAAFPVTTRFDADQFVSGAVVINASAGLVDRFGHAPSVGTVLQHELGHAVGLGHILDPFQLMSPVPVVTDWGKGDLAGLELLGEGQCLDFPTAEYQAAIVPAP